MAVGPQRGSVPGVGIISIADNTVHELGAATDYTGDPKQSAVFASVPGTGPVPPGQDPATLYGDTAIEHRVVGGTTTTLVSSLAITQTLNLGTGTALRLEPTADPTGARVAVDVGFAASPQPQALLLYGRDGTLVATGPSGALGPMYWSPSGHSLAYLSPQGDVVIWTPGGTVQRVPLPTNVPAVLSCVWSPDERYLACAGYNAVLGSGPSRHTAWVLLDRDKLRARVFSATTVPLLWVNN